MKHLLRKISTFLQANPLLAVALALAITLSALGANWGRVECWNLDDMAFRGTQSNGLPHGYLKPPLHTYINHLLVMKPAEALRCVLGAEHNFQRPIQFTGARIVTITLFCGFIVLMYRTAMRCSGSRAAAIVALVSATSAGLIKFNHFGTADSPLLFWMMASFAMAIRAGISGKITDALLAGALAGLAAADKYNGLGVAVALPATIVVHRGWKAMFGLQSWAGVIGVGGGFIIGNPGSVLDTHNFVQDFLYNLYTTPVYTGVTTGAGYVDFLGCFPEIIGWPGTLLAITAVAGSLLLLCSRKLSLDERAMLLASGAVFLFYFATIGRFPRMADRFVLPVIPFVLLFGAPAFQRVAWRRALPFASIGALLGYNILCSVILDLRFLADPRMKAQLFALTEFHPGVTIENTYAPHWEHLPGCSVKVTETPYATGRSSSFAKIFGDNPVIRKGIEKFEQADYPEDTFTLQGLQRRGPDYVAFSNQAFQFTADEKAQRYYADHLAERLGYRKVFEASWRPSLPWTYPKGVDFLVERMIILKKSGP